MTNSNRITAMSAKLHYHVAAAIQGSHYDVMNIWRWERTTNIADIYGHCKNITFMNNPIVNVALEFFRFLLKRVTDSQYIFGVL